MCCVRVAGHARALQFGSSKTFFCYFSACCAANWIQRVCYSEDFFSSNLLTVPLRVQEWGGQHWPMKWESEERNSRQLNTRAPLPVLEVVFILEEKKGRNEVKCSHLATRAWTCTPASTCSIKTATRHLQPTQGAGNLTFENISGCLLHPLQDAVPKTLRKTEVHSVAS